MKSSNTSSLERKQKTVHFDLNSLNKIEKPLQLIKPSDIMEEKINEESISELEGSIPEIKIEDAFQDCKNEQQNINEYINTLKDRLLRTPLSERNVGIHYKLNNRKSNMEKISTFDEIGRASCRERVSSPV